MTLRLTVFASALATAMLAAGIAGFSALAGAHPNAEPSIAAGCIGCHEPDYRAARHHVGEKPMTCGVCHAQTSWHPQHLEHPFALTGAHAKATCFQCHTGEPAVFHGTSNACYACHEKEYEAAPFHVGHLATTCGDCHGFDAWKPATHEVAVEPPPEPPPPPPPPTVTASTPPTPTVKPKPKPKPTITPPIKLPPIDVLTHPSRRE